MMGHKICFYGRNMDNYPKIISFTPCYLDGWMDDAILRPDRDAILRDDNERPCAMELRLRLRRFHLE